MISNQLNDVTQQSRSIPQVGGGNDSKLKDAGSHSAMKQTIK